MQSGGQQAVPGAGGMLELDGLRRRYGDVAALDGLSFTVPPGWVFGFLGPNGAGKTTAMRAIVGVAAMDGGEVRWRGQPIGPEIRRQIGYMPEERGLYPSMRVLEQLEYLSRLHGLTAAQARAAALSWSERLGLADQGQARIESLSLGNQQRVGMGLLAVTQIVAMVAVYLVLGNTLGSVAVRGASGGVVLAGGLWLLLGYAFYCTAYAAAGSLITRQADAYNASLPLQLPLILAYVLAYTVLYASGVNWFYRVLAFVPFTAPVAMPVLVAVGAAPAWQLALSAGISIAATIGMARLAGTIYERAILRTGTRLRLRQVLRSPR